MKLHNPHQLSILVEAQATYYPNQISIFIPKQPFLRQPTAAPKTSTGYSDDLYTNNQETDLERSIRRTKKRITDYTLCNPFELFVTFTFKNNRQDIDEKRRQMANWLRNQRKRNGKFDYLIVPEFHKDGQSLHFHALFNSYCGTITKAINPKTDKQVIQGGKPVYTLPEYTLGFNNAKNIIATPEDQHKVARYIKKYIVKDMPMFNNRQRYWVSKGLKLPIVEDNPAKWYLHAKPDWEIDTDNGRILKFNIGSHSMLGVDP
jgi:hypothetical protein